MSTTALRRACLLLIPLCLLSTASLSAQFGGLKKKAAQVAGVETAPAKPAAAAPAPEVTPTIVDHYLAGLKARAEERERIAHGNTPAGKYYAAVAAKKSQDTKCRESMQYRSDTYLRLLNQQKYDSATAWSEVPDTICVKVLPEPPEPDFEELSKAKGSEDSAAAVAAGLQVTQWAQLEEWIPPMVTQMVQNPDQNTQTLASNYVRKVSEAEAIKARKDDLAKALGIAPRAKKPAPDSVAAPSGAAPTGGACLQTELAKQRPAMDRLSALAETADKKGDNHAMMAIADSINQINMAAMRKCGMM